MSIEQQMLSQESINYLSSIDKNVVALNTTANAQRFLMERRESTGQVTEKLTGEVKQSMAARIQNQAYLAYGTAQQDMRNLAGFTDESTRQALTTMRIAGGNAVQDVRELTGAAATSAGNAAAKIANMFTPRPIVEQGIVGAGMAAAGLTYNAPSTMFKNEYQSASAGQVKETFQDIGNKISSLFTASPAKWGAQERGKSLDWAAWSLNRFGSSDTPGKLTKDQRRQISDIRLGTTESLEVFGRFNSDEATKISGIGESAAIGTGARDVEDVKRAMKEFTNAVNIGAKEFQIAGPQFADALKNLMVTTRMTASQAHNTMQQATLGFNMAGMSPQQSLAMFPQITGTARNYQVDVKQTARTLGMYSAQIERQMDRDPAFAQQVALRGGIGAAAGRMFGQDIQFRRGEEGFMAAMAMQQPGFKGNESLVGMHTMAARTASGGALSVFRAKYDQMFDPSKAAEFRTARQTMELRKFEATSMSLRDLKLSDIKIGGGKHKEFVGFLAITNRGMGPQDIRELYNSITGQDLPEIEKEMSIGATQMIRRSERGSAAENTGILKTLSKTVSGVVTRGSNAELTPTSVSRDSIQSLSGAQEPASNVTPNAKSSNQDGQNTNLSEFNNRTAQNYDNMLTRAERVAENLLVASKNLDRPLRK